VAETVADYFDGTSIHQSETAEVSISQIDHTRIVKKRYSEDSKLDEVEELFP
jgi:hypothetical protein